MTEYKYRVIDDNNKVEERIFDNFEEAYEYAISSGALLPRIDEYMYKDGVEWDRYNDCPVEEGDDASENVWNWDDTWDKEKAISQVKGRHYLEDDIKEPVNESCCEEELDDSALEKDDIDKVCPKCGKTICECNKQVVECNKVARDPKILEAALDEAIKLEDEELDECNLSEKADDPKLQVARELAKTDMFKDWPANLLYFTVINAYQQDVYGDAAKDIDDFGIKAREVKAEDIIDWVGNLDEWILEFGYDFSNNQLKQLIKRAPVLSQICLDEYLGYLDDDSDLDKSVNTAVNFIFEEEADKDENLDLLADSYNSYLKKENSNSFSDALITDYEESLEATVPEDLADNRQPAKEINNEVVSEPVNYKAEIAKEKGIDESLSQEISADYKYASKYYGIPELQQYVEEWYEANYPDWILPEFAGDVIYSEKYWAEFEAWLKANKNIDLEAIRNSKNVEEGLTTAPATSDQELQGADCAVVNCQGDNKVIAHSEDEKPLDCKMKKKPLEKPLTEDYEQKVKRCAEAVAKAKGKKLCNYDDIWEVVEFTDRGTVIVAMCEPDAEDDYECTYAPELESEEEFWSYLNEALEKPLTEAAEEVKPFLVNCEADVCDNVIYAKSEDEAIKDVERSLVENGYYAGDEIYSVEELTADNYLEYKDYYTEAELEELKDYFEVEEDFLDNIPNPINLISGALHEDFKETTEDATTDVVNGSSETEPVISPEPKQKDGLVEEAAKKVMKSYQDANRWLDSIKESVYYDLSCPVLANYIHEIAHKMPIEFDAFGTILHTANYEIPYPATEDLDGKPENIAEAIDATLTILDTIKDSLNEFIKITDENYHGMSCSAEELLMHIEAEYPMLYRLLKNAEKYINDTVSFDKFVGQYVNHKDDLLESLNEDFNQDLNKDLAAHNTYIEYLQKELKEVEEREAKEKNEFIKLALQRRIETLNNELNNAIPEEVKNKDTELQVEEPELVVDVPEENAAEEIPEEAEKEEVKESFNNDEQSRLFSAAEKLGIKTQGDLINFSKEHGNIKNQELLVALEKAASEIK